MRIAIIENDFIHHVENEEIKTITQKDEEVILKTKFDQSSSEFRSQAYNLLIFKPTIVLTYFFMLKTNGPQKMSTDMPLNPSVSGMLRLETASKNLQICGS